VSGVEGRGIGRVHPRKGPLRPSGKEKSGEGTRNGIPFQRGGARETWVSPPNTKKKESPSPNEFIEGKKKEGEPGAGNITGGEDKTAASRTKERYPRKKKEGTHCRIGGEKELPCLRKTKKLLGFQRHGRRAAEKGKKIEGGSLGFCLGREGKSGGKLCQWKGTASSF